MFLDGNACRLHGAPEYPEVCDAFPLRGCGGEVDYAGDVTLCPEFVLRPDLLRALRGRRAAT